MKKWASYKKKLHIYSAFRPYQKDYLTKCESIAIFFAEPEPVMCQMEMEQEFDKYDQICDTFYTTTES